MTMIPSAKQYSIGGGQIARNEFLRRGATLSLVWALLENLKERIGERKSTSEIRRIIVLHLAAHYPQDEDLIEELKVQAWALLRNFYTENDQNANTPNIIEEIFFANIAWFSKIDISLERHFGWISVSLIDNTPDSLPVRSREVAAQFDKMLRKTIFDHLKEEKRQGATK